MSSLRQRSKLKTPLCLPRRLALIVLAFCILVGCNGVPWRKVPLDAATGFYEQASLSYRLDAGQLQQPLEVMRVEGQRISYDQVASSPLPDQSIGTLAITYPHPDGRNDVAQAKFVLDSTRTKPSPSKSWNPFRKDAKEIKDAPTAMVSSQPEVHEVWTMDLPRAESDLLFKLLANQGFYNTERPQSVGAQLTSKINGTQTQKNWDQLPELNALIQRVRRSGQLVAYSRPGLPPGQKHGVITSTQAYSDLLARTRPEESQQLAAANAASPFALGPATGPPPGYPPAPAYPSTVAGLPTPPQR